MKRIISFFLALMLFFTFCITVYATNGEDTKAPDESVVAKKEILFRGIPWGSSHQELLSTLSGYEVKDNYSDFNFYSWEWYLQNAHILNYGSSEGNLGYKEELYIDDFKVAGLPVDEIIAYYLYGYDDNGVYYTIDKAFLYKAFYHFDVPDSELTFDVLKNKLSSLYGTPNTGAKTSGSTYLDWATWDGANDTAVLLERSYRINEYGGIESDTLQLKYGKSNSIQLKDKLIKAIAREELREALAYSGTDGL